MSIQEILHDPLITAIWGAIGGAFVTWIFQQISKKRGTFSYVVSHNKIGTTADDRVFGNVQVLWNARPITNLYLTSIELINESLNDYEDVVVSVYSSSTELLSEQTHIVGGPNILHWTEDYKARVQIAAGASSDVQKAIFNTQRQYIAPVVNRGQVIKFTYLHSVINTNELGIWLAVDKKGVKLKQEKPKNIFMGVPQGQAAVFGVLLGLGLLPIIIISLSNLWLVGTLCFIYGLCVLLPGALLIKGWRFIREAIGG